jgi:putative DNA primase/helicase
MEMTETPKQAAGRLARAAIHEAFTPEALHEYTDANGRPLYWRIRARLANGQKWIRPLRIDGDEYELREPEFPNGKPLYGLHQLAANRSVPVWYVEGENCANALAKLGLLATTAGSAQSDELADFTPLAGRAVTIWPDNDTAGMTHGERVSAKLQSLGCTVEAIDACALGLPENGDCVDWLAAHHGATAADLAVLPRLPPTPIENDASGIVLRCIANVEARPVHWLWPGRIARGKVSLLAGHPGLGKSQLALNLAGTVTTGGYWPVDRTRCEVGSVLILSAEDDPEDTIRPRLEAAGTDLSRCHILEAVQVQTLDGTQQRRGFSLETDITRLSAALVELRDVSLIIIDPITAYLGRTDSHKNAEVRTVLAALAEVAARFGAAVLAVSHLRKSGGEALMQVMGSLAFVAAARAAYVVVKDQDNPARRLVLPIKNNLGEDQTGYAFRIDRERLSNGIETSRTVWEAESVAVTADEALAPLQAAEERSAVQDAGDFLRGLLASGPVPSRQVKAGANAGGHAWAAIRRAQKALGVRVEKCGMLEGWEWRLPSKVLKNGEDAQEKSMSTFGRNEHLREPSSPAGDIDVEYF